MRKHRSHLLSLISLIVTLGAILQITQRGEPVVISTNLENIPMQIYGYKGTEDHFPDSVYEELNADLHLYRHYRSPDGITISLYIGYYGTAKGGRSDHNPYACLPGAGWGIIQSDTVSLDNRDGKVKVNEIVAQKGNIYETVLHWYHSDEDKVLASGFQQNIQRFINRIKYNRNDGAFVRLTMVTQHDDLDKAKKMIRSFAEIILNIIPNYWPEEKL